VARAHPDIQQNNQWAREMKRFAPTLLLLPFIVVLVPHAADSTRTVDVTLSRFAFSPERIEVRLGERVVLNVVSVDGPHGFRVKELGLDARTPARGKTATIEFTPKVAGTFQITCSEYCGSGHTRMKAWLTVTPGM
jgi:cytochrome c oxidase subunit II